MRIIRDVAAMHAQCLALKRRGKSIGFVPTMGALHEGHLSLMRRAKYETQFTCVSIFVNPTQFGPAEDFARYPRSVNKDIAACRKERVDFLFMPTAAQMYGKGFRTHVEVEGLSEVLCGVKRPGHFRGVATVVAKLFNIVIPDRAYFGQKDYQQTVVVRRLTKELNFPVRIRVLPTVREPQGLAMSSRNAYLGAQERRDALSLSRALRAGADMVKAGERNAGKVIRHMRQQMRGHSRVKMEYCALVDCDTLVPLRRIAGTTVIVMAARVGKTRLIDNVIVRK